ANLRMMERLLRRDFRGVKATYREDAEEILATRQVSLLVTDPRMAGMSGTELLRQTRATNPDMVRMVVTRDTASEDFLEAIKNSGAIRVINKPWDPDKVMQAIVAALERYEVMVANKQAISQLKQANMTLDRIAKG